MRRLAAATSFIFLAVATVPAYANTLNISGTFSGNGTLTPPPLSLPYSGTENFTGNGSETSIPFGSFTGQEQSTVNVDNSGNLAFTAGTFLWTFATGSLSGTFTGGGNPGAVTINFLITGGLLPGDSGSGSATESFIINGPNSAQVAGSFSGTITAPGEGVPDLAVPATTPLPSTWLMLLSGFVGLGFLTYRGSKKSTAAALAA